jgi:hypothetical protein
VESKFKILRRPWRMFWISAGGCALAAGLVMAGDASRATEDLLQRNRAREPYSSGCRECGQD